MSDLLSEALADRYRIIRELGRGGMATVYLADDLKHGRPVAIKVMLPALAAVIGPERFIREIEIAARLTHPHIIPLHDSGTAAGSFYYVMPYIAGESLRARLARDGPLPLEESLRLAREIAGALGHAHNRGLVHRDIKPENILLADGIALVADFGIAHVLAGGRGSDEDVRAEESAAGPASSPMAAPGGDSREFRDDTPVVIQSREEFVEAATLPAGFASGGDLTIRGSIIGTPRYMAPEQVTGSPVDARTDIYALACVLYEMLAGHPPFTSPEQETLFRQHLTETPAPITTRRSGVPPGIDAVLDRALSKDPAGRHPTALAFAEALAAAVAPGTTIVPSESAAAASHNLPKQRTRFVGRERELAHGLTLLEGTRLLTLTGIGGCGKTRLAIEMAERRHGAFPDGIWFVDLAPVQDTNRVAVTVATTLGLRDETDAPIAGRIAARLSDRTALLVLDNCEHLLAPVIDLVESLLASCRNLSLLLTSREGLGVPGEQVMALGSLAVPSADMTDSAAIAGTESVRLFLDRARLSDPAFELDDRNAVTIAEVCRRLDGIPLAIELAAVRVKVLSVDEIRARLDDRFRLLTGGNRTALPRHQTLRSAIGWSYDLLSESEQRLFRRMAVFAGGWTLDAAARVAADEADEFEILDGLTRLVEKSLVIPERLEGDSTRYSMLETVRQYARERLNEAGDGNAARVRHLDWFVVFSEMASKNVHGADQKAWFSRMDRERENLLAAHDWCDHAPGAAAAGLTLAFGWAAYWNARGLFDLGLRLMREALARPGAEAPSEGRNMVLIAAAQFELSFGRFSEAKPLAEEALSIARKNGDPKRLAQALRMLGFLVWNIDGTDAARRYMVEAVEVARRSGHAGRLAHVLNDLAEIERQEGHVDQAVALYEEAVALHRGRGDHSGVALCLLNLAAAEMARGRIEGARSTLLESLVMTEDFGFRRTGLVILYMTAGLAALAGEPIPAGRFLGAAEAFVKAMAFHIQKPDEMIVGPLVARARRAVGDEAFLAAHAGGGRLTYEEAIESAGRWLAGETEALSPDVDTSGG